MEKNKNTVYVATQLNKLEFEGFIECNDPTLNYIELPTFYVNARELNRKEYDQVEAALEKIAIRREKYNIFFSYDVSGFDYWHNQEDPFNYIVGVVSLTGTPLNKDDLGKLSEDIYKAVDLLWELLPGPVDYNPWDT